MFYTDDSSVLERDSQAEFYFSEEMKRMAFNEGDDIGDYDE